MTSISQQINDINTSLEVIRQRLSAFSASPIIYAATGAAVFYGCKVTEGASAVDNTIALEGLVVGDESHHNPDASETPTRFYEYPNIAGLKDGAFATLNVTAVVSAAPATGLGRIDIAYIYIGQSGCGFAVAAGTPSAGVKTDFDLNGLSAEPYGEPNDPALPVGALPVARIYVEDVFAGIANARIADIRVFGLSGLLTSTEYWANIATTAAANALVSEGNASTSETNAAASAATASDALDSIDALYINQTAAIIGLQAQMLIYHPPE